MASPTPAVRVVVKLPWNRPENATSDPPPVEWNEEKADMLWKVMARSRASDSAGTDWKGLAAHLEVPLPYLLYRAQTRFEEDLKGLQDIRGALSPTTALSSKPAEGYFGVGDRPSAVARASSRLNASGHTSRLSTPLGVRARLASLGSNSSRLKTAGSASTLTPQAHRSTSAVSSESESDTDEDDSIKEEEAERNQEEQEAIDKKLHDLQLMITNDALGLVSSSNSRRLGKSVERGRVAAASPREPEGYRHDGLSSASRSASQSTSQSLSSSSSRSPPGSIPSIPSPPELSRSATMNRRLAPSKSSSPPAVSPRSARGQSHLRYGPMSSNESASENGSNYGSEASSFSDLSDASLSASALESALMSNVRPNSSRFTSFTRGRFTGRGGGVHH